MPIPLNDKSSSLDALTSNGPELIRNDQSHLYHRAVCCRRLVSEGSQDNYGKVHFRTISNDDRSAEKIINIHNRMYRVTAGNRTFLELLVNAQPRW
ncbi:hypothetical protein J6590_095474 [Homalodisca vitripennis]|nr:hypothetical protein J6590_095474 [Homalodisca vitripennis]